MIIKHSGVFAAGVTSSLLVGVHLLAEKRILARFYELEKEKKVETVPVLVLNATWHAVTAILLASGIVFTCNGLGLDKFTLFGNKLLSTSSDSVDVMSKLNLGLSLVLIYMKFKPRNDNKEGFLQRILQMPQSIAFLTMFFLTRQ
ncbi:predicted protein [Naegleria gruberi]|uniref:Predicted protein n=1 Tax=Naegleria gruberi TaxID=5762 RepID=D2W3N6_NAEGR|nr:uncharacterized protein NAEGRDRAFT_76009 [Naegleria gruberi]EFC36271.1 predicted protein [Naegleria gruberi]|eukprot:XP_002669015.1 predicted protein [Naegleria gruberi strain NEG-M]